MTAPAWVVHAVWWHVYPLGALGAEAETTPPGVGVQHRLGRLEPWLDYCIELGCSGLALGPIFASETHGYDTTDHLAIDPRLGDDADFDQLVAACSRRGLRLLLDGVFNHVGRSFARYRQAEADGAASESARWFRWDGPGRPAVFEGHPHLVVLNHGEPAVADYVASVMDHWLDRGVSGWRLDAAYAVPDGFWAQVLGRVRDSHPDMWTVAEIIHGDYAARAEAAGFDSVTQYELWKAIWSSINDGNWFELAWALRRQEQLVERLVPTTFVGNHDVTRLASRLDDERHLAHALVLLMTLAGVPWIYYGDEQAFRATKEDRVGGDDAVRPALPTGPDELDPGGWSIYRLHQELIGLRRRHPWLHRARTRVGELSNRTLSYTSEGDGQWLTVALNLDGAAWPVAGGTDVRLLAGPARLEGATVVVDGHGWAVWEPAV